MPEEKAIETVHAMELQLSRHPDAGSYNSRELAMATCHEVMSSAAQLREATGAPIDDDIYRLHLAAMLLVGMRLPLEDVIKPLVLCAHAYQTPSGLKN